MKTLLKTITALGIAFQCASAFGAEFGGQPTFLQGVIQPNPHENVPDFSRSMIRDASQDSVEQMLENRRPDQYIAQFIVFLGNVKLNAVTDAQTKISEFLLRINDEVVLEDISISDLVTYRNNISEFGFTELNDFCNTLQEIKAKKIKAQSEKIQAEKAAALLRATSLRAEQEHRQQEEEERVEQQRQKEEAERVRIAQQEEQKQKEADELRKKNEQEAAIRVQEETERKEREARQKEEFEKAMRENAASNPFRTNSKRVSLNKPQQPEPTQPAAQESEADSKLRQAREAIQLQEQQQEDERRKEQEKQKAAQQALEEQQNAVTQQLEDERTQKQANPNPGPTAPNRGIDPNLAKAFGQAVTASSNSSSSSSGSQAPNNPKKRPLPKPGSTISLNPLSQIDSLAEEDASGNQASDQSSSSDTPKTTSKKPLKLKVVSNPNFANIQAQIESTGSPQPVTPKQKSTQATVQVEAPSIASEQSTPAPSIQMQPVVITPVVPTSGLAGGPPAAPKANVGPDGKLILKSKGSARSTTSSASVTTMPTVTAPKKPHVPVDDNQRNLQEELLVKLARRPQSSPEQNQNQGSSVSGTNTQNPTGPHTQQRPQVQLQQLAPQPVTGSQPQLGSQPAPQPVSGSQQQLGSQPAPQPVLGSQQQLGSQPAPQPLSPSPFLFNPVKKKTTWLTRAAQITGAGCITAATYFIGRELLKRYNAAKNDQVTN